MNELMVLTQIGPFTVTAYSLFIIAGTLLGVLVASIAAKRTIGTEKALSLAIVIIPCALIGARLVYLLFKISSYVNMYEEEVWLLPMLRLWDGGYTLWGGVLGGMLGAWLWQRHQGLRFADVADTLAPGAAAALMLFRLGEYFTGQGVGPEVENEALWFFPFGMEGLYGWVVPVFFYEALAALVIMGICMKRREPGRNTVLFLTLLSLSQILLENLRQDEFIMIPVVRAYIRLNMLAGALVTLVLLILSIRQSGLNRLGWIRLGVFFIGVGIVIGLEFAFDKSPISNVILYGIMACALAGMGWAVLTKRQMKAAGKE